MYILVRRQLIIINIKKRKKKIASASLDRKPQKVCSATPKCCTEACLIGCQGESSSETLLRGQEIRKRKKVEDQLESRSLIIYSPCERTNGMKG